jgi:hypothetical protein
MSSQIYVHDYFSWPIKPFSRKAVLTFYGVHRLRRVSLAGAHVRHALSSSAYIIRAGNHSLSRSLADVHMIRKLPSGEYRLYSRKVNPKTGKRRNLGTFDSRSAAMKHEKAVQYFKRQ